MREEVAAATLLSLGAAAAVIAAGASAANPGIATPLAAIGAGLAGFGGVLLLMPSVRHRYSRPTPLVGATLVLLRDAFRSGPLGRQAIIATVVSLELQRVSGPGTGMNPEEERRIIALDPPGFRLWLDDRLEQLERET